MTAATAARTSMVGTKDHVTIRVLSPRSNTLLGKCMAIPSGQAPWVSSICRETSLMRPTGARPRVKISSHAV